MLSAVLSASSSIYFEKLLKHPPSEVQAMAHMISGRAANDACLRVGRSIRRHLVAQYPTLLVRAASLLLGGGCAGSPKCGRHNGFLVSSRRW